MGFLTFFPLSRPVSQGYDAPPRRYLPRLEPAIIAQLVQQGTVHGRSHICDACRVTVLCVVIIRFSTPWRMPHHVLASISTRVRYMAPWLLCVSAAHALARAVLEESLLPRVSRVAAFHIHHTYRLLGGGHHVCASARRRRAQRDPHAVL